MLKPTSMHMLHNDTDTIASISTPIGESGIGIVRMSGSQALAIADAIFVSAKARKPSTCASHTIMYGRIMHKGATIDEVLVAVMRAGRSYTREDVVEINCHGGIRAVKEVLDLVVARGARLAEPGEFTKRAFLNGRIDLAQAEATLDIIRATTDRSLAAAVDQLEGTLSRAVNGWCDAITDIIASIEASIDFPDEETEIIDADLCRRSEAVTAALAHLIATFDNGVVLRQGVLAVICGRPNVGKSSMMNVLLKRDRVIVTPIPGTTRDAIEELITLNGIPIRLVDTAGITETHDVIEQEGIRRGKSYVSRADIILLMLDGSSPLTSEDQELIRQHAARKKVIIINKVDLPVRLDRQLVASLVGTAPIVELSVTGRTNIEALERAIVDAVWQPSGVQGEHLLVTNARHKALLDRAHACMVKAVEGLRAHTPPDLIAVDVHEALVSLGLIVGRSVSDDIIEKIFSTFCIGK